MPVDPTPDGIRAFVAEDPGGPVVMLNLLRYRPDGGRERYGEYSVAVLPFLQGVGGEVLYAGECSTALVAPSGHAWDSMLLVRYPNRQAFLDMVMDPDYQGITHLRTEGLEEAVLQATHPWG
jgi:uncharacterized protein (DUF1330 family)